ncbi:MAG: hypothetical protein HYX27_08820 [Acidobacteria bacterium]|nr:hypothetical protein [Acidobacteriota bacterium]
MALESVDLLTLLRRARNSTLPGAKPEAAPVAVAAAPAPDLDPPAQITRVEAAEELAGLRAELYADEVLIRRILGLLYRCKKKNPNSGYLSILDMERTLHVEREGASFVMSYMKTQKVIEMDDKSRMAITVPGIEYLRSVLGLQTVIPSSAAGEAPEVELKAEKKPVTDF